jgi:anti-sigma factor RsiW
MSRLSEEDRAELVAYLDGELDETASQALEARLNRDSQMRAEVEAFKKTWDLLDYLPRPEPSASFTHRTLERLAVRETNRQYANGTTGRWAWLTPIVWGAAMLVAMAVGLFAAHRLWSPPGQTAPAPAPVPQAQGRSDLEEVMAKDADMLKSFRYYERVDDVDMLRQLSRKDAFGEEGPRP